MSSKACLHAAAMACETLDENCQFCLKPRGVRAQRECESRQKGRKGISSTHSHAWESKLYRSCAPNARHGSLRTLESLWEKSECYKLLARVAVRNFWHTKWQQDEGGGNLPLSRFKVNFKPFRSLSSFKINAHAFSTRKCLRWTQVLASFPWDKGRPKGMLCGWVSFKLWWVMRYDG